MADFISFLSTFLGGASSLISLLLSLPFLLVFPFVVLVSCFCISWGSKFFRG